MNFYAKKFAENLRRDFKGLIFVTRITIVSHLNPAGAFPNSRPGFFKLSGSGCQITTIMTVNQALKVLGTLHDHADGQDVELPAPSVVQATIETCIMWGRTLQAKPRHRVHTDVASDSLQLDRLVDKTLAKIAAFGGCVLSIQYAVRDTGDQEHKPPYSVLIHYTI